MYGFTLIFVLGFVGGLIAYFGDKIGMKVGRKRLTLFGIRPKYTGIIITIGTGIFISLASILVLSIASDDVRIALFEMKEIQATLATNQLQLEQSMSTMAEMEASLEIISTDRDRVTEDFFAAQIKLEDARQEVDELELRRDELMNEVRELVQSFALFEDRVRFGNVAFRADEIIFAEVIVGGSSLEESSQRLVEFLTRSDQIAYQLGARVDEESQSAIIIDGVGFDMAAYALHQQPESFVVRSVSEANTMVGEPVKVYLELISNHIVFTEGEVLAEIDVDLDLTPEVDKQIIALLNLANMVAVNKGMITHHGGAVKIPGDDFLSAIENSKKMSGIVTIKALASEDAYAIVGPLELKLELVPTSQ